MKVHVEIDCTPEEARSFMGLPDVGKANAVYVDMMSKAMTGVSDTHGPDRLQAVPEFHGRGAGQSRSRLDEAGR